MKDSKLRYELLLQLVENAQDGVTVAEKEGNDTILLYVNEAFEQLTGYQADDILYQDCRFLQGEDTDRTAIDVIREDIEQNKPVRTILKNYRQDGSVFWNELSITPYFDEVDKVTYYIGIQKDVTEQVELADQLAKAEKTIEQLQAELNQSQKA